MIYDWETKHAKKIQKAMKAANAELPDHLALVGVAVANINSVEAALVLDENWPSFGMVHADCMQDVKGDAERMYSDSVISMRKGCDA